MGGFCMTNTEKVLWTMGLVVFVGCGAADVIVRHCESWPMIGATLVGGTALALKFAQKIETVSETASQEPIENDEENEEEDGIGLEADKSLLYSFGSPVREIKLLSPARSASACGNLVKIRR